MLFRGIIARAVGCFADRRIYGTNIVRTKLYQISGGQTQRNIRLQRNTWSRMFSGCPQISVSLFWQCFVQNGRWSCAYLWNITSRHKTCHSAFRGIIARAVGCFADRRMRFMGLTLSEQSYTRYLEGKLRETFGFSGTPEAECFSGTLCIWYNFVLTMFRPKWQVVLCLLVKHNK